MPVGRAPCPALTTRQRRTHHPRRRMGVLRRSGRGWRARMGRDRRSHVGIPGPLDRAERGGRRERRPTDCGCCNSKRS